MKNIIKKIGKSIAIQIAILSVIVGGVAFAVTFPTSTPAGQTAGGKFMEYFNKIRVQCDPGQALQGFDSNFNKICVSVGTATPAPTTTFTCGSNITVGGFTYTTKIGLDGKCWTSTNMKHTPKSGNSWCYDNNPSNCDKYGRLYDGYAALDSSVCGLLGTGWTLPTEAQWTNLINSGATGWSGNKLGELVSFLPGMYAATLNPPFSSIDLGGLYWADKKDNQPNGVSFRLSNINSNIYDIRVDKLDASKSGQGLSVLCINPTITGTPTPAPTTPAPTTTYANCPNNTQTKTFTAKSDYDNWYQNGAGINNMPIAIIVPDHVMTNITSFRFYKTVLNNTEWRFTGNINSKGIDYPAQEMITWGGGWQNKVIFCMKTTAPTTPAPTTPTPTPAPTCIDLQYQYQCEQAKNNNYKQLIYANGNKENINSISDCTSTTFRYMTNSSSTSWNGYIGSGWRACSSPTTPAPTTPAPTTPAPAPTTSVPPPVVTCAAGTTSKKSNNGSNFCEFARNSGIVDQAGVVTKATGSPVGSIWGTCGSNGLWNYSVICPDKEVVSCTGGGTTANSSDGSNSCTYAWSSANAGATLNLTGTNGGTISGTCIANGSVGQWSYTLLCPNKSVPSCPAGGTMLGKCSYSWGSTTAGQSPTYPEDGGSRFGSITATCGSDGNWISSSLSYTCNR